MGGCLSGCFHFLYAPLIRRTVSGHEQVPQEDDVDTSPAFRQSSKVSRAAKPTTPIHISQEMSSPKVLPYNDREDHGSNDAHGETISGHGLALADSSVPHDGAAYWEWQFAKDESTENCLFGVSTKRNPQFYDILAKSDGSASSLKMATKLMRPLTTASGDTVGVAIDLRTEKPMVQLYLNGELMEEFLLKHFRGAVYPSIWLPPESNGTVVVTFVHNESHFRELSPHARFLPLCGGGASNVAEIV